MELTYQNSHEVIAFSKERLDYIFHNETKALTDSKPEKQTKGEDICVRDHQFKTQYSITINQNEFPVIGTYIDERVVPGFYYRVRRIATDDYLFDGEPRLLIDVGIGYGKRITFKGDQITDNSDFYFYSDTEQRGFAFSSAVPNDTKQFSVQGVDRREIAKVKVTEFHDTYQDLATQRNENDSTLTKKIKISFTCNVSFGSEPHGMLPLHGQMYSSVLDGVAHMTQVKLSQSASLQCITDVEIPGLGLVSLYPTAF